MITCMPRWGFDAREMSPFSSSRGVELRGVKPDRKPARSQRRSLSIFLEELSDVFFKKPYPRSGRNFVLHEQS